MIKKTVCLFLHQNESTASMIECHLIRDNPTVKSQAFNEIFIFKILK